VRAKSKRGKREIFRTELTEKKRITDDNPAGRQGLK